MIVSALKKLLASELLRARKPFDNMFPIQIFITQFCYAAQDHTFISLAQ